MLVARGGHEAAGIDPGAELQHRPDVLVDEAQVAVGEEPPGDVVEDRQGPAAPGREGQAPAGGPARARQGQDAAPGAAVPRQVPGARHPGDVAGQALDEGRLGRGRGRRRGRGGRLQGRRGLLRPDGAGQRDGDGEDGGAAGAAHAWAVQGVSGTGVRGPRPSNQAARLSTTSRPMAARVATEAEPTCGSSTTWSRATSSGGTCGS